jgi:hypothetical protein
VGLKEALARSAARRAHVLVVETPGHWRIRAAAERHAHERGWILARSPADADVLAVCGLVGTGMGPPIEQVWQQMPGPRVRIDIDDEDRVEVALARAAESLADTSGHLEDAATRPGGPDLLSVGSSDDEHADTDHSEHGSGHEEHGGGHHDMGHDMEMAPHGVALAEGEQDRDGMEMDVLRVRLGPVLPHWPAGLVLRCSLHGDVITGADVEQLDGQRGSAADDPVARRCDAITSLLALAGWDDAAADARRLRDRLLSAGADDRAVSDVRRLHRRVARSWLLRWCLRGVRPVHGLELEEHRLPRHLSGDTYDRLLTMVERAHRDLVTAVRSSASDDLPEDAGRSDPVAVDAIPRLVHGLDLATARLVVASLDLDVQHAGRQVSHG